MSTRSRLPLALVAALVAGVVLRAVLFAVFAPWDMVTERSSVLRGDAGSYHLLARNMLGGDGFSMCVAPPHQPDNYRTPLYPALVACVFAVAGTKAWLVLLLQIGVSAASLCLFYVLCRRLWGATHAAYAAWIYALCPLDIACTMSMTTETMFVLLMLCLLCLWFSYLARPRPVMLTVVGILIGLCALCRPVAFYMPAAFLVLLCVFHAMRRTIRAGMAATVLLLAGYVLVVAPWLVRNHVRMGTWKLSCADGMNLLFGQAGYMLACEQKRDWPVVCAALNGLLAERYEIPVFPPLVSDCYLAAPATNAAWARAFLADPSSWQREPRTRVATVVDLAAAQMDLGKTLIRQHPLVYAKWSCVGIARTMLTPPWQELLRMTAPGIDAMHVASACARGDTGPLRAVGAGRSSYALLLAAWTAGFTVAVTVLMLVGLAGIVRRGNPTMVLTWLVLCAYFLVLTGPQGHSRYREQCAPIIVPLAAYGLYMVVQRIRNRGRGQDLSAVQQPGGCPRSCHAQRVTNGSR